LDALDLAASVTRPGVAGAMAVSTSPARAGDQTRVLRDCAVVRRPAGELSSAHLAALDQLITGWRGQGPIALPGGFDAIRASGTLCLRSRNPNVAQPHVTRPCRRSIHVGARRGIEAVLIAPDEIEAKIGELAAAIDKDYVGRELLLVGVLKGARCSCRPRPRAREFVAVGVHGGELYGNATTSSGVVRILKDLDHDIACARPDRRRHHRFGTALSWLLKNLGAASLLRSRSSRCCANLTRLKWTCGSLRRFDIPNEFVVGYGLDYGERYRGLRYIAPAQAAVYGG